jgi:hypothetical protein
LPALVLHYQRLYRSWSIETEPERRAALRDSLCACQEQLWPLLAEPLLSVARSWLHGGVARDMLASPACYPSLEEVMRSLAMNMYIHVLDALPQIQVDPSKNLLAYLKTIAKRGMFDEQQRIYRSGPRRPSNPADENSLAPGSRDAHMWNQHSASHGVSPSGADAADLPDPQSLDFENQIAALLDQRACCQAIWTFWETLGEAEQRIVLLRWNREPPVPYEDIALQLGPGWTAQTIRQRHCRLLQRTRDHLQRLGLLDGTDGNRETPSA